MQISVIIPVYNAAAFIEKATSSALAQEETAEVILIEDNSIDNCLEICRRIASGHKNVKLFQHYDRQNHGPGASRNLGIQKAIFPFISFLDADDFYLPNRFKKTKEVFEKYSDADGVYEALGVYFYSDFGEKKFKAYYRDHQVTMLRTEVSPEQLFQTLIDGDYGWFSLDALVVKREVLFDEFLFDTSLNQGQDTDFIWRLALHRNLFPGNLNQPVAMRGIHKNNRIFNREENRISRMHLFRKWFFYMLDNKLNRNINRKLFDYFLSYNQFVHFFSRWSSLRRISKIILGFYWLTRKPRILIKILFKKR